MNSNTPLKPRATPARQGPTPFRSSASRFRSSLVPMSRASPSRSTNLNSKLTATSTLGGSDIFRTSTPQSTRTTKFAPNLPQDATRTTPTARKFAQKGVRRGMSSVASTEPFKMKIPSPGPELSGEALSKEVPNDPNRTGTIYADQFLAHKCPPSFDDVQRRQFFCVLDLRRLKYVADEIFAKKDWKLNIMNFAKEYEKSRGLIMLRYGLYEFKNVKPSEEVQKKWRATHNLPEPEPETEKAPATSTQNRRAPVTSTPSAKRKAEDDLTKDNALMTSNTNQNKRRNMEQEQVDRVLTGPAPFKKSKRKMDETDEPDENQPSKIQKPTPSAAKSKFESILNRSQSGSTSPTKRPALAPFGSQNPAESQSSSATNKSTPFTAPTNGLKPLPGNSSKETGPAGSVLSNHKIGSAPVTNTGNIFGFLSESSTSSSSGNENGNAEDDDTESEPEEESGSQEEPPSKKLNAAGSTKANATPAQNGASLFSTSKPTSTSNLFGGMDKSSDTAPKGGLFGRVQMGSNGQPLREQNAFPSMKQPSPEKEQSKTPAKQPGDYTFNASTTPITFSQPAASTSKPSGTSEAEPTKDVTTTKGSSLFGAGASVSSAFQPSTQLLFATPGKTSDSSENKANAASNSIFSANKSGPLTSSLFGSTTAKPVTDATESGSSTVKEQPKKDSTVTETKANDASSTSNGSSSFFGASPATSTMAPLNSSLFGNNTNKVESKTNGNAEKPSTSNLFGSSFTAGNAQTNGSSSAKSIFDTPKQPSASFTFGASKVETEGEKKETSISFNQGTNGSSAATPKSLFDTAASKPTTSTAPPSFSGNGTTFPNLFGSKPSETASIETKPATPATSSIFANSPTTSTNLFAPKSAASVEKKEESAVAKPASIFSNTPPTTAAPIFSFGAQPAAPTTQSSSTPSVLFGGNNTSFNSTEVKTPDFSFGSSTPSGPSGNSNPFAFGAESSSSGGDGFTFTAGGGQSFNNPFASQGAAPSTPMFGGNSTPAPASSFTFGQQAPSTPNPAPANSMFSQGTPAFGGSFNGGNGAPSLSFTQATPTQNNSNPFAPKSAPMFFGGANGLQPGGGDGAATASSPFPAPSSIGTTPVNGTPEPQTQNEDGEEGTHEQISLTNGGPGEEDETILHEVRAKAIKYVPVVPGSDEEADNKSPWSTQGVGPLRVLKNKTTGSVRLLLRAEPRGHIALNKALLSGVEYKAKEKTVSFMTSNDTGSGLESWLLQVKKPDMARELVTVLEANKNANK